MDHYTYVFVGNSAGAMAAVRELRAVDGRGSVLMLSEEPYAAYSRPLIAKHVSEGKGIDAMQLAPASYYPDEDIELRLSTRAVSIDYSKHTLALADGASLGWDRLLLATGSTPIVPSIPGTNLGGVFTFATFDDAKAVAARLPVTRHAVVIGGGFIGLSAADALLKRTQEPTDTSVDGVIAFLADQITLNVDQTPVPVVRGAKLKGLLRSRSEKMLPNATYQALEALFDSLGGLETQGD